MPDRTACKYCGKTGFVRRERVLKGGSSVEAFYCGACDRSWEVHAHETQAEDAARRSENDDPMDA
jgi:hypothetical protein